MVDGETPTFFAILQRENVEFLQFFLEIWLKVVSRDEPIFACSLPVQFTCSL